MISSTLFRLSFRLIAVGCCKPKPLLFIDFLPGFLLRPRVQVSRPLELHQGQVPESLEGKAEAAGDADHLDEVEEIFCAGKRNFLSNGSERFWLEQIC